MHASELTAVKEKLGQLCAPLPLRLQAYPFLFFAGW